MYDLIIIGGGPAGLTAAIYAIRKRLNVLLVTQDLGGKTNFHLSLPWIEDYQIIRGLEVVNKFKNELEYLDFARHLDIVEKVERLAPGEVSGDQVAYQVKTRNGEILLTRAVIIATGAKQVRLKVPGEREYMMKGLCYSALSYAPLFIDRQVVVVGDGELAVRSASELVTIARKISLVLQSPPEKPDARHRLPGAVGDDHPLVKKLKSAGNVNFLKGYKLVEVKGDVYARSVMLQDPQGRYQQLDAEGIFIEMATVPNTALVEGLVELDEFGRIPVDHANCTHLPGVFAAGDVTNVGGEQVLIAVGEGAKAALAAYDYLLKQ